MAKSNPWMLVKDGKQVKFRPPFGTMAEMLLYWAKKQPEKTAIEFIDVDKWDKNYKGYKNYSWRELKEKVFAAAEMLKLRGLKRGDTIAFAYHNHPNILILSLAAWASGMKTVPLDLKRDDEEMMKYKLELSGAKAIFGDQEGADPRYHFLDTLGGARASSSVVSKMISSGQPVSLSAEALVLFTSGTTAKPKGAVLTQENLVANADGIADWLEIKNSDKFMIVLPLHHINSTTMSLATLLRGGTIVLVSRYTNSRFFEIAAKTGATLTSVVPTIIHDQLGWLRAGATSKMAPSGQPLDGLRQVRLSRIQLGSAPVSAKEAEEFVGLTGIPLIQGYGQTETALRSTGVEFRDDLPRTVLERTVLSRRYWGNLRSNTIGEEMKWTNVTILRGDGKEGKEGQEGEIAIRGPVIMKEYLKNPEATGEAFKYGWFHSGDLGYWKIIDGKRQFFIKGRIKEIIIKAGANVSPPAVEEKILKSAPEVDQVYVVGIPDERVGEEVGAAVVWKKLGRQNDPRRHFFGTLGLGSSLTASSPPGQSRSKVLSGSSSIASKMPSSGHFVVKGLSDFERPKYWFSLAAQKLPMTSTGKVQRVKLREMFKDCAAVAETEKCMFRVISVAEEGMIEEARQMYNKYWTPLSADKKSWEKEKREKTLIGAIDKKTGELMGWIRVKAEGKTVMADAVTAGGKKRREKVEKEQKDKKGEGNTQKNKKEVETYLRKRIDPIIEFHRKPKAGWKKGARFVKVVANARPGDTPALGYGVLMEYPEFAKMEPPKLTDSSLGTQLVEAGLVYARKMEFKRVRVLSRPVGLWKWIRGEGKEEKEGKEGREGREGKRRRIRGIYRNLREIKGDKR